MYEVVDKTCKSVLCIKADLLERKNEVQKKIQLESLMESCKYLPLNAEEIPIGDGYVPLTFGVTIRDLKTNKVLVKRNLENNIKRTFIYMEKIQPVIHVGYDLVMYLTSVGVTSLLKDKGNMINFSSVMATSVFDVNGLLWLEHNTESNCILLDPMVMTTVYVDHKALSPLILDNWKFEDIADIKKEDGFIQCILDDLIEIKGGEDNEHNDQQ